MLNNSLNVVAPCFMSTSTRPASGRVLLPLDQFFEIRATAAIRLWRALTGHNPGPNPAALSKARRDRLILALRALDGWQDHASYREIAGALSSLPGVSQRGGKSHDLRDRTIRLVRRAWHDAYRLSASAPLSISPPIVNLRLIPICQHMQTIPPKSLRRDRRMLEDLRFEVSAAMAGKQIAADAACVRGPYMLSDGLICPRSRHHADERIGFQPRRSPARYWG